MNQDLSLQQVELSTSAMLKKVLILASPAIVEMLLNTLVGVVDTIMVGRGIGAEGLAAINLANQIVFPIVFIFSAFNVGTTAIVSRYIGAKAKSRANKIASQSCIINLVIGLILTALMYLYHQPLMALFNAEPEVTAIAIDYLKVVIYSQFFMFISFSLSSSFRGAGDTVTPMAINGAINILNIIGNWLLIFGIGIFPELGIVGAAISTTLSRAIGAIVFLIIGFSGKMKIKLVLRWFKLKLTIFKKLWRISWSAALEQLFMQSSYVVFNYLIIGLGTITYSAFNIIVRIESILFMPIFGFSIATTTLVGQYLGAKGKKNAIKSVNTATICGGVLAFIVGISFIIFPEKYIGIFIEEQSVIKTATLPLRLTAIQQIANSFFIIYSGAIRGAGDTLSIMVINIVRLWILLIPLTYLIINYTPYGLVGHYIIADICMILITFITYLYFKSERWMKVEV